MPEEVTKVWVDEKTQKIVRVQEVEIQISRDDLQARLSMCDEVIANRENDLNVAIEERAKALEALAAFDALPGKPAEEKAK